MGTRDPNSYSSRILITVPLFKIICYSLISTKPSNKKRPAKR
nr:MAG TPA: hypothetical protein [Caudoviricetes sp.]